MLQFVLNVFSERFHWLSAPVLTTALRIPPHGLDNTGQELRCMLEPVLRRAILHAWQDSSGWICWCRCNGRADGNGPGGATFCSDKERGVNRRKFVQAAGAAALAGGRWLGAQ